MQAPREPAAAADGDPRSVLRDLIAERDPIYAEADVVVASGDGAHDTWSRTILAAVDAVCRAAGPPEERAMPRGDSGAGPGLGTAPMRSSSAPALLAALAGDRRR